MARSRYQYETLLLTIALWISFSYSSPSPWLTHHDKHTSLDPPADMVQRDVFSGLEMGYKCFRSPALLYTSKGVVLAFAEGRGRHTGSCKDTITDVEIVMKNSSDGGMTWSSLTVVYSEYPKAANGKPAPAEDVIAGKIILLFSRNTKEVLLVSSMDGGVSWRNVTDITDMIALPSWFKVAPGLPGGLQLPSGRLIFGAYAPTLEGQGSFSIYSDDGGKTWEHSLPIGDSSAEECQIAPLGLNSQSVKQLIMTMTTPLGHMMAYSNDSGETWKNQSMPETLNPQTKCESSILAIPYGGVYMDTHLYITQPYSLDRQNVTFFHSVDGGKTWKPDFLLWQGPSAYSSMAYDADRYKILCLFECGVLSYTEKLTLAVFSPLV